MSHLSEKSERLHAALDYAGRGWPVFPLHSIQASGCCTCGNPGCLKPGKHPRTQRGLKDAAMVPVKIAEWWALWPNSNVAILTGHLSKLVVLDVDGEEGKDSLRVVIQQFGALPATLESTTGRGTHLYCLYPTGKVIRNSVGRLGKGLDIRGEGGYAVAPPSIHEMGTIYKWSSNTELAPFPESLSKILTERRNEAQGANGTGGKIPKGRRNDSLFRLGWSVRAAGASEQTITQALARENELRCDPPLEITEVLQIARSAASYQSPWNSVGGVGVDPWESAESMDTFLSGDTDPPTALVERVVHPETITEIFAPRGLGKSLWALYNAIFLAANEKKRVLLLDRDNPRRIVKARLNGWGAGIDLQGLKIISREKCPTLRNAAAWVSFPYTSYDIVFVDSVDSMAEGVGEQDSSTPSRAFSHLLDIAHRQGGPAVVVPGNCVRTGKHSRGSGVIEDRADIVYEVRDATGFHPSGNKPWVEELPPADVGSWVSHSQRRKQREIFRLAFVCTKFRLGEEPEPFILKINTTRSPWTLADVTDEIDREGAAERERHKNEKAATIQKATGALVAEIIRRHENGDRPMLKDKEAIPLLIGFGLKRKVAREVINASDALWVLTPLKNEKGHPVALIPRETNRNGGNDYVTNGAKSVGPDRPDFRQAHEQRAAEIGHALAQYSYGSDDLPNSAEPSITTEEQENFKL